MPGENGGTRGAGQVSDVHCCHSPAVTWQKLLKGAGVSWAHHCRDVVHLGGEGMVEFGQQTG